MAIEGNLSFMNNMGPGVFKDGVKQDEQKLVNQSGFKGRNEMGLQAQGKGFFTQPRVGANMTPIGRAFQPNSGSMPVTASTIGATGPQFNSSESTFSNDPMNQQGYKNWLGSATASTQPPSGPQSSYQSNYPGIPFQSLMDQAKNVKL